MSIIRPVTILGGLPAFAQVSFGKDADTPNGPGDYWSEVDDIFWRRRDGSIGKSVPRHVYERAMEMSYNGCDIAEQVSDQLAYERWEHEELLHAATAYQRGWLPETHLIHRDPWSYL